MAFELPVPCGTAAIHAIEHPPELDIALYPYGAMGLPFGAMSCQTPP
jgi:hypothetical protein